MSMHISKIYIETYYMYDALANLQWADDTRSAMELKTIAERRLNVAKLYHDKRMYIDDSSLDLSIIQLDKPKDRLIRMIDQIDGLLSSELIKNDDNNNDKNDKTERKMLSDGIRFDLDFMHSLTAEKNLSNRLIQCQSCGAVGQYITSTCIVCGAEYNKMAEIS